MNKEYNPVYRPRLRVTRGLLARSAAATARHDRAHIVQVVAATFARAATATVAVSRASR